MSRFPLCPLVASLARTIGAGLVMLSLPAVPATGQPAPGDWYREFTWTLPGGDQSEAFLRVGGRFDYRRQRPPLPPGSEGADIRFPFTLVLDGATRAEVSVEKTLCHDHTTGLAISLNGHPPRRFPEAGGIPQPAAAYMHHFHPTVEVPLEELRGDGTDHFSLSVDPEHPWNWPQNLVYAVTVRLYLEPPEDGAVATMAPLEEGTIAPRQPVAVVPANPADVARADFVARYEGPDLTGDGHYRKWHYHTHRGALRGHVGTAGEAPFVTVWETEWIPDQEEPVELGAILTFRDGRRHFVPPVAGRLERNHTVEFCRPYGQPPDWVTRNGRHTAFFDLQGDLNHAEAFRIVWRSWSPGYLNGLYLNDFVLLTREGANYAYDEHRFTSREIGFLRHGRNWVTTGETPHFQGEMVHGAEILWPGPMVLVKYDRANPAPHWKSFAPRPDPEDFAAAFRGAWSPEGLLVKVEVQDPEPGDEDEVRVLLRTDPVQLRSAVTSDGQDLLFRQRRGAASIDVFRQQVDRPPLPSDGVGALQRETADGWEAIFLIPWELLGLPPDLARQHPLQLGFELTAADQDGSADTDHRMWASRRRISGFWINHNEWGVAQFLASDPVQEPNPRTDWTNLPTDEPPAVVTFPAWTELPALSWDLLDAGFAGQPANRLDHWLPSP